MTLKTLFILGLALFFVGSPAEARSHKKIRVQGALKAELNAILRATNDLHAACFDGDAQRIEAKMQTVINHIKRAHKKSALARNERPHLVKILDAARDQLEMSQMQQGKARQSSLKMAFGQLVQIAKIFHLDKYRIFFCPKDRAVWLQKSWRAKNPINPERFKNCGKLVRG